MMLLTFLLDDWRCALDISVIEKTYRAAALNPLPETPEIVLGIVDIGGSVFPAISLRRRFSLPEKSLSPGDHFILAHTPHRPVVLVVDAIDRVIECSEQEIVPASDILPALARLEGVLKLQDGLVLIQDLAKLLSLDEHTSLAKAMEESA